MSANKRLDSIRAKLGPHPIFSKTDINSLSGKRITSHLCGHYSVSIPDNWNNSYNNKFFDFLLDCSCLSQKSIVEFIHRAIALVNQVKRNRISRRRFVEEISHESKLVIGNLPNSKFYTSTEWLRARYAAFDLHGNRCLCCGRGVPDGVVLHVDHIKPRVLRPDLSLDLNNLQILCELCNLGKRCDYITDWRE